MNLVGQFSVELSTVVIFILSTVLAGFLTRNYVQRKSRNYLFWSIGLWLFSVGVLEEIIFSLGYYDQFLIKSYLGVVAVLVESLALGSIQMVKSEKVRNAYYLYAVLTTIATIYILSSVSIGNVLINYVVFGALPLSVIVVSSVITFPAAAIIVVTAALSYRKSRSYKMLSIISGVIVVSIAGSLYIAEFPAFLYFSEFAGILLLWLGFYSFRKSPKLVENPGLSAVSEGSKRP